MKKGYNGLSTDCSPIYTGKWGIYRHNLYHRHYWRVSTQKQPTLLQQSQFWGNRVKSTNNPPSQGELNIPFGMLFSQYNPCKPTHKNATQEQSGICMLLSSQH